MRRPWLTLHYDSIGRDIRRRAHLERTLAEMLWFPQLHEKRSLGDGIADALGYMADKIAPEAKAAREREPEDLEKEVANVVRVTRQGLGTCTRKMRHTLNQRIGAFIRRFREWRCSECAISSSCNENNRNVAHSTQDVSLLNPPPCLSPFVGEIEVARDFVENLYLSLLPSPRPRLHADLVMGTNRGTRDCIDGSTRPRSSDRLMSLPRAGVERSVRIEILFPKRMHAKNSFSLIYVAAHELGVHAFERFGNPNAPYGDREFRGFSEGLVDKAIYEALLTFLKRRAGAFTHHEIGARDRHALHSQDTIYGDAESAQVQIVAGHVAYAALEELGQAAQLNNLIRLDGHEWALQVALVLNMADLQEEQREDILTLLQSVTDRSRLPNDLDPHERLIVNDDGRFDERLVCRLFDLLEKVRETPSNEHFLADLLRFCELG